MSFVFIYFRVPVSGKNLSVPPHVFPFRELPPLHNAFANLRFPLILSSPLFFFSPFFGLPILVSLSSFLCLNQDPSSIMPPSSPRAPRAELSPLPRCAESRHTKRRVWPFKRSLPIHKSIISKARRPLTSQTWPSFPAVPGYSLSESRCSPGLHTRGNLPWVTIWL